MILALELMTCWPESDQPEQRPQPMLQEPTLPSLTTPSPQVHCWLVTWDCDMCDQAPSVDHRPSLAGLRRLTGGGMVSPCRWSISIIINYQSLSLISRQHLSSTLALVSALLRSMDTTTSVLTPGISSLLITVCNFSSGSSRVAMQ